MKNAIQKLVAWIVLSSANPEEISLTVKGALIGVIPTLMAVAGVAHINLGDGSLLTSLVDSIAQTIQVTLTLIATAIAAWGALRKVYYVIFPRDTELQV